MSMCLLYSCMYVCMYVVFYIRVIFRILVLLWPDEHRNDVSGSAILHCLKLRACKDKKLSPQFLPNFLTGAFLSPKP